MRPRITVLIAVVTAALLAGGVAPAAAMSERAAATRALPGRMLDAPRPEAFVKRLPVRVAVRVPARTSRLRVRVGRRHVTARFRRARGSLRVAHLRRSDGLRYGPNRLFVIAERRRGRPLVDARSFVLARRHPQLVRLRVRNGPVTSLSVRVAGKASLAPEHFRRPGEVAKRLSVIRRSRTARLWLNGRRITRALDRSRPTHWTARLSATQGLRHGVNRLRLHVAEPDNGRYVVLRRRFRVRRDRHLAAAGWDTAATVGGRVRLDGRRSRTAGGGRARHSWRILAKPAGSRAALRRARTARPLLIPDRPGRYVIGLRVTGRTRRATASQVRSSSTDRLTITVRASSLLVPFTALTRGRIQVGDTPYPNPQPGAVQWLTLDRATLRPTKTGNSWIDGGETGEHGVDGLVCALSDRHDPCHTQMGIEPIDLDELVILSYQRPDGSPSAIEGDQLDAFNRALNAMGVASIEGTRAIETMAAVGVPSGGDSSGYKQPNFSGDDLLTGWLMPDATSDASGAVHFRYQPERPAFNTSLSSTPTTNIMTLGDRRLEAALPAGATGGFQVVKLGAPDLTVLDSQVFATNGVADPASGLAAMAAYLNENTGPRHVAVQSIGHVEPSQTAGDPASSAWYGLSQALAEEGANPHTFNTVGTTLEDRDKGSYAFLGGFLLERTEVVESSSAVAVDDSKNESGKLSGRASIGPDGILAPVAAAPTNSFESPLYDIAFRDPTPWPYTCRTCDPNNPGAVVDVAAYKRALADITHELPDLKDKYPDLRQAYVGDDTLDYSHSAIFLAELPYPGDGRTCAEGPGPPDPSRPAFTRYTREQFCNLNRQLQLEFDWLDLIKDRFNTYETVLTRSNNQEQANLETIGNRIQTAVAPPPGTTFEILTDLGNYLMMGFEAFGVILAPEVLIGLEAAAAVFEVATSLASDLTDNKPLSDQIKETVDGLSAEVANRLFSSVNAMDRLRDVINSDYGRLKALGSLSGWNIDRATLASRLTDAANTFFSSQIMPVAYGVYALVGNDDPETCRDALYGHTWRGAPRSAQMEWQGGYDLDGYKNNRGRFILGQHQLSIRYYAYPPKTLTDQMFSPTTRMGYGVLLPDFVWEQYNAPAGKRFPPTDIGVCH